MIRNGLFTAVMALGMTWFAVDCVWAQIDKAHTQNSKRKNLRKISKQENLTEFFGEPNQKTKLYPKGASANSKSLSLSAFSALPLSSSWENLGGSDPGSSANVLIEHDGDLYIGGYFFEAGGANGANMIARWDGGAWQAVADGLTGTVEAMAFIGTTLYVGGSFEDAGGVPEADFLAKWDGNGWSAVGSGVSGTVRALATDGTNLYVGGNFASAGGVGGTVGIAKWDGANWSALNTGLNGGVNALVIGSGDSLYVGGQFSNAGGNANADYVAVWDGDSWEALGTGTDYDVSAIAVSGADVYVGGLFIYAGGLRSKYIAHWNGSTWSAMDSTLEAVSAVAVHDGDVYASGNVNMTADAGNPTGVVVWNGSDWIPFGGGINSTVRALLSTESGLVIGSGPSYSGSPALWNGSSFSFFGSGLAGSVEAIATSGSNIYIGGYFTDAFKNNDLDRIAKWDGNSWSALGSGLNGLVNAMGVSGSNVYAGGEFTDAGGISGADYLAMWNGSSWAALGNTSMINEINVITVSGTDVYVGGVFTDLGGVTGATGIAKWNGSSWEALGSGLTSDGGDAYIASIAVSGSDVYVGGYFDNAGGNSTADNIAKWNGSSWSTLGDGLNSTVYGIAVIGSDVYAGGEFDDVIGGESESLKRVAKWNGSTWEALGGGISNNETSVYTMIAVGSHVYAGGSFSDIGGVNTSGAAKWNGDSWEALGDGLDNSVSTMAASGNDVYMGGDFLKTGSESLNRFAVWHAPSQVNALLVTSTADDSTAGNLRYAIGYANNHAGADTIRFDVSLLGQTIVASSPWPPFTSGGTVMDGDVNGDHVASIQLDAGGASIGLNIQSANNEVRYVSLVNASTLVYLATASAVNNKVIGNKLGMTLGNTDAGSGGISVEIGSGSSNNWIGDGTTAGRNYIARQMNISGKRTYIRGNYIGLKPDGTTSSTIGQAVTLLNDSNYIGDSTPQGRNVIAGSSGNTIAISNGNGNVIEGNYIGTDASGNTALKGGRGIVIFSGATNNIIGGNASDRGNVIAANNEAIYITGTGVDGNQIINNHIGVGADGATLMGGSYGVHFQTNAASNLVETNVIAGHTYGIRAGGGAVSNRFFANSIHDNGTPILIDAGSQQDVVPPRITAAAADGSVSGTAAPHALVQVYADESNEGEIYKDTARADGTGNWSITTSAFGSGWNVTALQDSNGNTSAFSLPFSPPDPLWVTSTGDDNVVGTLRYAIGSANDHAGPDTIRFDPSILGQTIAISTALPAITNDGTVIDGDIDGNQVASIRIDGSDAVINGLDIRSANNEIRYMSVVNFSTLINLSTASADNNKLLGNKLGLTLSDSAAGFATYGVYIASGSENNWIGNGTAEGRNYIAGRGATNHSAILVSGKHTHILGNYVGLKPDGVTTTPNNEGIYLANDSNLVGNTTSLGRNVIAANAGNSVVIASVKGNVVQGNYIGTDASGNTEHKASRGVIIFNGATDNLIGGSASDQKNVIAGNLEAVYIVNSGTNGNRIINNHIGVGADGATLMGGLYGVRLEDASASSLVEANVIAGHTYGIRADGGAVSNRFFANSIHDNGTPILIDAGSQQDVAPPRIASATEAGVVSGTAAPHALVQVYADESNEGEIYKDTARADGTGNWSITTSAFGSGWNVTALQDSNGNTSAFSLPFTPSVILGTLSVLTPDVHFGSRRISIDSMTSELRLVASTGPVEIQNIINPTGSHFKIISSPSMPTTLLPGTDTMKLIVKFKPLTIGMLRDTIRIISDAANGMQFLALSGTGLENIPPTLTIGVLRSTVLTKEIEIYLNSNEGLSALSGTVAGAGAAFTQVSGSTRLFSASYRLTSTGNLNIALTGTDSVGNSASVNRSYTVGALSKDQPLALISDDRSVEINAPRGTFPDDGFILVNKSSVLNEIVTEDGSMHKTVLSSRGVFNVLTRIELITTVSPALDSKLTLSVNYPSDYFDHLRAVTPDFDERKIGIYRLATDLFSPSESSAQILESSIGEYIGGEGTNGKVTAKTDKAGRYAVIYNPDHVLIPKSLELSQNYPNPFNPTTTIRFSLPETGQVKLIIYNVLGQRVKELVNASKPAGYHEVIWNGKNESGVQAASGLYIYRLETADGIQSKKMLLIK
jgi:hypothetical protein